MSGAYVDAWKHRPLPPGPPRDHRDHEHDASGRRTDAFGVPVGPVLEGAAGALLPEVAAQKKKYVQVRVLSAHMADGLGDGSGRPLPNRDILPGEMVWMEERAAQRRASIFYGSPYVEIVLDPAEAAKREAARHAKLEAAQRSAEPPPPPPPAVAPPEPTGPGTVLVEVLQPFCIGNGIDLPKGARRRMTDEDAMRRVVSGRVRIIKEPVDEPAPAKPKGAR